MTASSHSLPFRASLENLRKQAKTLHKQRCGDGDEAFTLTQAQHDTAVKYGFASWPKLVAHFESLKPENRVRRDNGRVWIDGIPRLRWGQNTGLTFLGSLEAAFRESDRPLDLNHLMGDSGLCFRLRWARDNEPVRWCGSGPVGEWPEERAAVNAATGYVYDWRYDPETTEPIERIVESIERGHPILGYPIRHDMGIVYGYEDGGQRVLVRDYWAEDDPHIMPATAVNGYTSWLTEVVDPLPRKDASLAGFRLAAWRWSDPAQGDGTPHHPVYYYGAEAYTEWINDLRRADSLNDEQRANLWFLNGWTYSTLYDTRKNHAAQYVRHAAAHLPGAARPHLEAAAACYDRAADRLGQWDPAVPTFGFVKQKKVDSWTPDVRRQEIALLEDLAAMDAEAIGHLEAAAVD